jgi:acetylornithine/succinyldiaminopimelate/putrescine aminotransferase
MACGAISFAATQIVKRALADQLLFNALRRQRRRFMPALKVTLEDGDEMLARLEMIRSELTREAHAV